MEFWSVKMVNRAVTAVASLTHVWVMVDRTLPTKIKDLALYYL